MDAPSPRLLVAVVPRKEVEVAIGRALPGIPWTYARRSPPSAWGSVEAILVGSVERELADFDPELTPRLNLVQFLYTGVDGFPFDQFLPPIRIAGNVGAYAPFVAEHAVALALAAARGLRRAGAQVREGRLRPPPEQRLLFRRTAAILGFGEIGRALAARLTPFEMHIVGVNRSGQSEPGTAAMFRADQLTEALRGADFAFECRPLTRSTRGTIGGPELAALSEDAVFINVGRAATVDEAALYRHLREHPRFRAGLDVWWGEDFTRGSITPQYPFAELPNVVATPHSAGFGPGVEGYVLDRALENLARHFRGEPPRHVVDREEYAR